MFYVQSIFILTLIGIFYIYLCLRTLVPQFKKVIYPFNLATKMALMSVIAGFGIVFLYEINAGMIYFKGYANGPSWYIGHIFLIILTLLVFTLSTLLFRMTFLFFKTFSSQNLSVELAKNNLQISGLFSTYFIILCLLITEPMIKFIDVIVDLNY